MLDIWPEMSGFKEKTARNASAFREFLTPETPFLGITDSVSEFSNRL
jgi:hypothetical protein